MIQDYPFKDKGIKKFLAFLFLVFSVACLAGFITMIFYVADNTSLVGFMVLFLLLSLASLFVSFSIFRERLRYDIEKETITITHLFKTTSIQLDETSTLSFSEMTSSTTIKILLEINKGGINSQYRFEVSGLTREDLLPFEVKWRDLLENKKAKISVSSCLRPYLLDNKDWSEAKESGLKSLKEKLGYPKKALQIRKKKKVGYLTTLAYLEAFLLILCFLSVYKPFDSSEQKIYFDATSIVLLVLLILIMIALPVYIVFLCKQLDRQSDSEVLRKENEKKGKKK